MEYTWVGKLRSLISSSALSLPWQMDEQDLDLFLHFLLHPPIPNKHDTHQKRAKSTHPDALL